MGEARWIKKRSLLFAMTLVVLLAVMQWVPKSFFQPLQGVLATVTVPFENLFSWGAFETHSLFAFLTSLGQLKEENAMLHQELLKRSSDQAALAYLRQENETLRRELELSRASDYRLVTGEVIAHERGAVLSQLRINRGTHQGLKPGMPVVSGGTILIGVIETVGPFTAEVRLLSHPESLVAVMVEGAAGEMLLRGDRGLGLVLDLARPNDKFETGSTVMTAGMSENLPGGLLVGTIETSRLSPDQLFRQAVVVPPVRADQLRVVSVITNAE